MDKLREVFDAVHSCHTNWRNLCLVLGISDDDLAAIEQSRIAQGSDDCLREGLSRWLRGGYGRPTWRKVVDAVANSAGGDYYALALDIAEKYKGRFQVECNVFASID